MKLARAFLIAGFSLALMEGRTLPRLLVVSDIHFNPLADPALAPKLMAAEPSQWEAIFEGDAAGPQQHYNDDSVWPLLDSLVSEAQSLHPKPKLAIVTGDILPHKFQEKFVAAMPGSDPAAFRSFVQKTVTFIGLELKKASGGAPVIYTLGNNDDECGDYALQPGGPFLKDTSETVQRLAEISAKDLSSWLTLGSYVTANPLAKRHRIIALDTTFWSRRYANSCAAEGTKEDPGTAEMKWLTEQLANAQKQHEKVWIVYHIPPGMDGHSSARANQTVPMWKPEYSAGFNQLLDRYRDTIELNLASHTHLDDFRLIKTEHANTLVLINPGLSPNVGQNPAFRLIPVNGKGKPDDLITYYVPDLAKLKWEREYSAKSAFELPQIDAVSYASLYQRISEPTDGDKWRIYYAVSRPSALSSNEAYQRSLYCATGHSDADAFAACLKQKP